MIKELEAFYKVLERSEFAYIGHKDVDIVVKALTPPTADEVCKALSEFMGREVSYTNKQFHYIIKNTQVLMFVTETYNNKTFSLGVYLPPHLITLIGRFYEGDIKDENI